MGKPLFDLYAFADYSGASGRSAQRKHIAFSVYDRTDHIAHTTIGLTREDLLDAAVDLVGRASAAGRRLILGFDHNYGFPAGFHEAVFRTSPVDWEQVLRSYCRSAERFREKDWRPRAWARTANEAVQEHLGVAQGPFWGTLFARRPERGLFTDYVLADGTPFAFRERRLVEEACRKMKPVYQIGGIGSVGQQTLYGLLYLRRLLDRCRREGRPLHVWPQHGLTLPEQRHVLVEVYPTQYLEARNGPRSDAGDAEACVRWISGRDGEGRLEQMFSLSHLSEDERKMALLEGWVLGI